MQKVRLIADQGPSDCNLDGVESHVGERKLSTALQPSANNAVPERSHSDKNLPRQLQSTILAGCSNLSPLGKRHRIIDIDSEVAHGVFDVGVTGQNLDGPQVGGRLVDERWFLRCIE